MVCIKQNVGSWPLQHPQQTQRSIAAPVAEVPVSVALARLQSALDQADFYQLESALRFAKTFSDSIPDSLDLQAKLSIVQSRFNTMKPPTEKVPNRRDSNSHLTEQRRTSEAAWFQRSREVPTEGQICAGGGSATEGANSASLAAAMRRFFTAEVAGREQATYAVC